MRRASLAAAIGLSALLGAASAASAQGATHTFEVRPFVGAYIPTGEQHDFLRSAVLSGAQLSWRATPALAVTGTLGWAASKDRITDGDQNLDIYQYDVGAELRSTWYDDGAWDFAPFVGLGVGGRTYDYRDLDVDSKSDVAGYGAVGGDVGFGRVGLRVEVRDYLSRFKPLTGDGDAETRNDVGLAAGFSYRF